MSSGKMGHGGYVPGRTWRDTDLTALDLRLLTYVAQHDRGRANGMGCYRTHMQMAADLRADRTSITTRLSHLISRGYLGSEPSTKDKRRDVYWIIYIDDLDNPYPKENVPAREHKPSNNVLASPKECSLEIDQVLVSEKETPLQERTKISGETEPTDNRSCETAQLLGNGGEFEGENGALLEMVEQWRKPLCRYWNITDPAAWIADRVDRLERRQTLTEAEALDCLSAYLNDARSESARQLYNGEISRWSDFPLDEWLEELEGHEDHD